MHVTGVYSSQRQPSRNKPSEEVAVLVYDIARGRLYIAIGAALKGSDEYHYRSSREYKTRMRYSIRLEKTVACSQRLRPGARNGILMGMVTVLYVDATVYTILTFARYINREIECVVDAGDVVGAGGMDLHRSVGIMHHLSYVRTDESLRTKMGSFSHAGEEQVH